MPIYGSRIMSMEVMLTSKSLSLGEDCGDRTGEMSTNWWCEKKREPNTVLTVHNRRVTASVTHTFNAGYLSMSVLRVCSECVESVLRVCGECVVSVW